MARRVIFVDVLRWIVLRDSIQTGHYNTERTVLLTRFASAASYVNTDVHVVLGDDEAFLPLMMREVLCAHADVYVIVRVHNASERALQKSD